MLKRDQRIQLRRDKSNVIIQNDIYILKYDPSDPRYVDLLFSNSIGSKLYIASGCDRDEYIDELIGMDGPQINELPDKIELIFTGETTLWKKVEYIFTCYPDKVIYRYRVYGQGRMDNARFFEGFLANDPRMNETFYPYFCGPGRHKSFHRPVKHFMQSSQPGFDLIYSFAINSSDTREFMYYENAVIRINGDRFLLGGDWLATPPPFLYLMGNRQRRQWVSMGLEVKPGEANFKEFEYRGGEGFGLNLTYDGYTKINGVWKSPGIVFQTCSENVYQGLEQYVTHLAECGALPENERSNIPTWWKKPIFGGWGEQVFHSNRWDMYFGGNHDDWKEDNVDQLCTQAVYEKMLATLEEKGIDPTILIVDNRWFSLDCHLSVDKKLWPDMKGFIDNQHAKGRKVILWISPWSYCRSAWGQDVPLSEQMILDETRAFSLEIDTDVFYPACNREKRKVRKKITLPEATLAEPHWKFFVDPLNQDYIKRVQEKIHYLLSPQGLDADGFEFDYTHFLPQHRGTRPIRPHEETAWGVELLHRLIKIYYDQAKRAKADALIISHTYNPYFNDVVDMLRLQDIYTDRKSIIPQMEHRARIAKAVCPDCVIHTDQHPMPSLEAWREYMRFQPKIGNPCLYYVTGIETTREKFTDEDFAMLRKVWSEYSRQLDQTAQKDMKPYKYGKSVDLTVKSTQETRTIKPVS